MDIICTYSMHVYYIILYIHIYIYNYIYGKIMRKWSDDISLELQIPSEKV